MSLSVSTDPPSSKDTPFLLVSGDFVQTGGMDLGNFHLARYLAEQGVGVHLVAHRLDSELLTHPNVVFHRAPRPLGLHLLGEPLLRRLGCRVATSLAFAGVRCVVNGGNCPLPDTNWVHYVHAASQPHGGSNMLRRWKNHVAHRLFLQREGRILRRAKVIIVNSKRTCEDLVRYYQLPRERIHLVYYGTDPVRFYPVVDEAKQALRTTLSLPLNKRLFVFIGALGDRRKGFDTLFAAWQAAGRELLDMAELIVIGQGAELPRWRERATELPGGDAIRFLGFRRDVPDVLRACDALVAPSRYEAFGLAAQEALCCGLPIIVSRSAGVSECIPPELAELLLHDPESVPELTDKLRLLNRRYEDFHERAKHLSGTLRTHTWNKMAHQMYTLMMNYG